MNRHQFEQAAKHFRAGRLTLSDFSAQVFPEQHPESQAEGDSQWPVSPIPQRRLDAHKGDFGRVLLIGGSQTMPGAIGLAGMAALRSGSGLVIVATPKSAAEIVAGFTPCYMTQGYDFDQVVPSTIQKLTEWADVIAIGPGLGTHEATKAMVQDLYRTAPQPMIVDADGLNCLADPKMPLEDHQGLRVLTPHPGEYRRLTGLATSDRKEMERNAIELAKEKNVTVILKGHRTLVTDGKQTAHNETGNAGMATGGSGDVLTGMVASLVGQGMDLFSASRSACHLHGLAGDWAANKLGQVSLISSDLLKYLPNAVLSFGKK